jgi:hypothetical protein
MILVAIESGACHPNEGGYGKVRFPICGFHNAHVSSLEEVLRANLRTQQKGFWGMIWETLVCPDYNLVPALDRSLPSQLPLRIADPFPIVIPLKHRMVLSDMVAGIADVPNARVDRLHGVFEFAKVSDVVGEHGVPP